MAEKKRPHEHEESVPEQTAPETELGDEELEATAGGFDLGLIGPSVGAGLARERIGLRKRAGLRKKAGLRWIGGRQGLRKGD